MKTKLNSFKSRYEMGVSLSDIQIPFDNKEAVRLVLKFIKENRNDISRVFLNGDIIDNWSVSTHFKNPDSPVRRLYQEVSETKRFFHRLRDAFPKKPITLVYGNHEFRFVRYVSENASQLNNLVTLDDLLEVDRFKIDTVFSGTRQSEYLWGEEHPIRIGHYDICRKNSAYTAKALMEKFNSDVIQGHTHRQGVHMKTSGPKTSVAVEQGKLCKNDGMYALSPDWQTGFVVIYRDKEEGDHQYVPIHIRNNKFIFNGKLYQIEET